MLAVREEDWDERYIVLKGRKGDWDERYIVLKGKKGDWDWRYIALKCEKETGTGDTPWCDGREGALG